jgi:hypothetical protein
LLVESCVEDRANVVHLAEVGEEGDEVCKLGVVSVRAQRGKSGRRREEERSVLQSRAEGKVGRNARVVEPRRDGHGVVDVENIRSWRVVDDDALRHWPAELREILRSEKGSGSALRLGATVLRQAVGSRMPIECSTHLHIVALVVVAALAEQTVLNDSVDVELVEDGVGVLGEGGGEDDDLVNLAHGLEEG